MSISLDPSSSMVYDMQFHLIRPLWQCTTQAPTLDRVLVGNVVQCDWSLAIVANFPQRYKVTAKAIERRQHNKPLQRLRKERPEGNLWIGGALTYLRFSKVQVRVRTGGPGLTSSSTSTWNWMKVDYRDIHRRSNIRERVIKNKIGMAIKATRSPNTTLHTWNTMNIIVVWGGLVAKI